MRSLKRKCVSCGRQSRGSKGTTRRSVTCQRSGRKRASLAVSEGLGRATGLHVAGEEEMEDLVGCRGESPLGESRCSDGQSQRGVQGLRNKQGGGRVGHSAHLLPRKFSGQMKITLRMKQEGGVGEAAFLAVPGVATRWRACLSHHLSLTCQMTRSLLQMPTEQLQQKDQQILLLLEEKEMIFRDMTECSTLLPEDCSPTHSCRTLFRSNTEEALKGGPLMKSAINEGSLHSALPPRPVVCTLALSTIEHFFSL